MIFLSGKLRFRAQIWTNINLSHFIYFPTEKFEFYSWPKIRRLLKFFKKNICLFFLKKTFVWFDVLTSWNSFNSIKETFELSQSRYLKQQILKSFVRIIFLNHITVYKYLARNNCEINVKSESGNKNAKVPYWSFPASVYYEQPKQVP